jgi:hypothetical protein
MLLWRERRLVEKMAVVVATRMHIGIAVARLLRRRWRRIVGRETW